MRYLIVSLSAVLCSLSVPAPAAEKWPEPVVTQLQNVAAEARTLGIGLPDTPANGLQADAVAATALARRIVHAFAPGMDAAAADALISAAVARDSLESDLRALLPVHDQYAHLRAALAGATDVQQVRALQASLARWRRLPHTLGTRFIWVNIPAFELYLVDGRDMSRYRVIVGTAEHPTPEFQVQASGVVLNPWWQVPARIARESLWPRFRRAPSDIKRLGYVIKGTSISQRPGPANALGAVKFVMPNSHDVYLHDTPGKAAFSKPVRTLSSGCVRVEHIAELAQKLLPAGTGVSRQIATGATQTLKFEAPVPIYISYMTAVAVQGGVEFFADVYKRDPLLVRKLADVAAMDEAVSLNLATECSSS